MDEAEELCTLSERAMMLKGRDAAVRRAEVRLVLERAQGDAAITWIDALSLAVGDSLLFRLSFGESGEVQCQDMLLQAAKCGDRRD